jgi:hypothetical protein
MLHENTMYLNIYCCTANRCTPGDGEVEVHFSNPHFPNFFEKETVLTIFVVLLMLRQVAQMFV